MNELGIICDIKDDKAKVKISDMVTDFLPVFQNIANSFAISFNPIRIGEQVLVIPICGDLNSGIILRGIYQNKHKTKNTNENILSIYFEDGGFVIYDSLKRKLDIKAKNINIKCDNLILNGNLQVNGNISDIKGDLTNHFHSCTDGAKAVPR